MHRKSAIERNDPSAGGAAGVILGWTQGLGEASSFIIYLEAI